MTYLYSRCGLSVAVSRKWRSRPTLASVSEVEGRTVSFSVYCKGPLRVCRSKVIA